MPSNRPMNLPAAPTPAWSASVSPLGLEIVYRPQKTRGFYVTLLVTVLFGLACAYVAYVFIAGWLLYREEILPAGVVLCALAMGGCWLAIRGLRWLYRTTTYTLGGSSLRACRRIGATLEETVIDKGQLTGFSKIYTPPKSGSHKEGETWVSALVYRGTDGSEKRFHFEGVSAEETVWLRSEERRVGKASS